MKNKQNKLKFKNQMLSRLCRNDLKKKDEKERERLATVVLIDMYRKPLIIIDVFSKTTTKKKKKKKNK